MKKFIAVLSALSLAAALTVGASAASPGDVNGDGKINSSDALGVLQYSVGMNVKEFDKSAADVNRDGKINSLDALKILRIATGLESGESDQTKQEAVDLYNSAINAAASAKKLTVIKTEKNNMSVEKVSSDNNSLKNILDRMLAEHTQPVTETKTFRKGVAIDLTKAVDFLPKAKLEPAGVKSAKVIKDDSGYSITIVTIEEKATLKNQTTKYTEQCAKPLDYSELDSAFNFQKLDLTYTGVTINAKIDKDGRLVSSSIEQPYLLDAEISLSGSGMSMTLNCNWEQTIKCTY